MNPSLGNPGVNQNIQVDLFILFYFYFFTKTIHLDVTTWGYVTKHFKRQIKRNSKKEVCICFTVCIIFQSINQSTFIPDTEVHIDNTVQTYT